MNCLKFNISAYYSPCKLCSESRSSLSYTLTQYGLTATFTNLLYLHSEVLHEHNVSLLLDLNFFDFFLLGFSDNADGNSIQFEMQFCFLQTSTICHTSAFSDKLCNPHNQNMILREKKKKTQNVPVGMILLTTQSYKYSVISCHSFA